MDRFIGVKAISSSGFYCSKNEYETAKLKGEPYYDSFDAYNEASKLYKLAERYHAVKQNGKVVHFATCP